MHPFIVLCLVLFPGTPIFQVSIFQVSIFQVSLTGPSLLLHTVEAAPPQRELRFGANPCASPPLYISLHSY